MMPLGWTQIVRMRKFSAQRKLQTTNTDDIKNVAPLLLIN